MHMRRFLSIVAEIRPRDFPVFFSGARVSDSNYSTVVIVAHVHSFFLSLSHSLSCKFNTLFELAAKKNSHKSWPKRKLAREHARMIESSMRSCISDIDRGDGKNSVAYRVLWIPL